ncbi:HAD hydrolase-like protein [Deinococcus sp. SDU3-2]|uniref:HAD hydrolase-like protein n=1 Tax=Deinococcus terrestris TaxID=2651870 RepID=A0A7X1NZ88_9DEIO|nr:HAD hydrolase-like protein [Deinococcus terrestris]MPY68239.1 HAD hydrolase-like protein [Deinococcus terrestris]
MLRLVIVDSTIISESDAKNLDTLEKVLTRLRSKGVKIALVSTNKMGMYKASRASFQFSFDYSLSGEEVYGKPQNSFKGGGDRITEICGEMGIPPHETLYIGDDQHDYASSLHSGCFFVAAAWKGLSGVFTAERAQRPEDVWSFASHYLLHPPRWNFSLDDPNRKFRLRTLASANTLASEVRFSGNPPYRLFNLKQLFKDKLPIKCGNRSAVLIMFWHTLASIVLENLSPQYSIFTVYPGSKPDRTNGVIQQVADIASKVLGSKFIGDLIVRAIPAPSSHELKTSGKDSFLTQTNSVILNKHYRSKIKGKTIVVFDDFHTSGKSLEWARNLFLAAGAKEVVMIAMGRFGGRSKPHTAYEPVSVSTVTPFDLKEYSESDFLSTDLHLSPSDEGRVVLQKSFEKNLVNKPFEEID